jgi:hypothetical protein
MVPVVARSAVTVRRHGLDAARGKRVTTDGTGPTLYLANNLGWPSIGVAAQPLLLSQATVTHAGAASIAVGERALTVDQPAIRRRTGGCWATAA